jgi:hypothetical protein
LSKSQRKPINQVKDSWLVMTGRVFCFSCLRALPSRIERPLVRVCLGLERPSLVLLDWQINLAWRVSAEVWYDFF